MARLIHLRGTGKTYCGLDLWVRDTKGRLVTSVDSVGFPFIPDRPVTCDECLDVWNNQKGNRMAAREVGTLKVWAGVPTRTDYQYGVLIPGKGYLKYESFDSSVEDDPQKAWHTTELDEAKRAASSTELAYGRLGVPHEALVVRRPIHTFVGDWETLDLTP